MSKLSKRDIKDLEKLDDWMAEDLGKRVVKLEERVAKLAVCCKSCTKRLRKLEKRLAQCVKWIEGKVLRKHLQDDDGELRLDSTAFRAELKEIFPD